jgi:hypothetical protein
LVLTGGRQHLAPTAAPPPEAAAVAAPADLFWMTSNFGTKLGLGMVRLEAILQDFPGLGSKITTDEDGPALETFALQFRKVLELIAFSGMNANKAIYEKAHGRTRIS